MAVMRREELRATAAAAAAAEEAGRDGANESHDCDRRRHRRSRSRQRRRSRSRARKRRGDDWESGHEGHALSSPGVIPNVVTKKRGLGGFDSATVGGTMAPGVALDAAEERPRQVAARG